MPHGKNQFHRSRCTQFQTIHLSNREIDDDVRFIHNIILTVIGLLPLLTHHRLLSFISKDFHHFFSYALAACVGVAFVTMVAENLRRLYAYVRRTAAADSVSITNNWYEDEFMAATAVAL